MQSIHNALFSLLNAVKGLAFLKGYKLLQDNCDRCSSSELTPHITLSCYQIGLLLLTKHYNK